jgi:hypothetical protein
LLYVVYGAKLAEWPMPDLDGDIALHRPVTWQGVLIS